MKSLGLLMLLLSMALILTISCEQAKDEIFQVTIKGIVTNGGQPVEGAIVLIFNDSQIDSGTSINIDKENINGSFTFSDGGYTIIQVDDGTYYIVAVKDSNDNKSYDLGIDPIGWYGHDSFGVVIPDPVVVEGEDITGINIDTLYTQ